MQSKAPTVEAYVDSLPDDRKKAIQVVRKVIRKNLGKGFREGMQYGMIGYYVPHSLYPPGYHCDPKIALPFAGLASQKNHLSLYVMPTYQDDKWLRTEWAKTGKKLDMGKCCIRFKKVEDLPLELVGELIGRWTVEEYINYYESAFKNNLKRKKPERKKQKAK